MLEVLRYDNSLQPQWGNFLNRCKNRLFLFERNFMDYHSDRFSDHSLIFKEQDKILAILPACEVDAQLISHAGLTYGGLLYDNKLKTKQMVEIFTACLAYLKENHFTRFIYKTIPYIFHSYPSQEDLYALHLNQFQLFRRDISSVINLKKRLKLSKGRKWAIKKAKSHGLSVTEANCWHDFMQLLNDALKKHNTQAVHSVSELQLLCKSFPQNIKLKVIESQGEILAGTVLFLFDKVIHTQYIATNEQGKNLNALDYLLEAVIEESIEDYDYFSFGISTTDGGKALNQGLIAQKEAYGARGIVHDFYEVNLEY